MKLQGHRIQMHLLVLWVNSANINVNQFRVALFFFKKKKNLNGGFFSFNFLVCVVLHHENSLSLKINSC